MAEVHNTLTESVHGGHAIKLQPPTIGQGCPGILNDMYPSVIYVRRPNLDTMPLPDYYSPFPFHLNPSK
jgi:hypothetical protein